MSEMKFTPAQQDAIEASGGSIIVSAAAGSGKTRVLVQRVIRLLTDRENPVPADRLLIVTFTKAAADEMRSRIAAAIDELLFYEPDNNALRRQQLLLPNADICTIHSFCSRMIRENFYLLDIDQDFRIASEGEADILRHRIVSGIIEERYSLKSDSFLLLTELLSASRSDRELEKSILKVYESCSSHPFPAMWLDCVSEFYDPEIPVHKTLFADYALRQLEAEVVYLKELLDEAEEIILSNPAFCTGTPTCGESKLNYLKSFLSSLDEAVKNRSWNDISSCIMSYKNVPYRKPASKKNPASEEECSIVKNSFDNIHALLTDKLPIFGITEDIYKKDAELLYPAVTELCDIIKEFDKRYFEAKKERGFLDFSDLEHLMLRLLIDNSENGMKKTEFAKNLSAQYDQIMVDEYQDTNETQECIFRFISKDETNLFVVGDIKQSIYRFREAMPEIFKNRRRNSVRYNREAPSFPATIILDRNFRSRDGIIDTVNFVFHSIMSERVGEITYNDDEKLTTGATYPETELPSHELHLLDGYRMADRSSDEEDETGLYEREASYIAALIKKKIKDGMTVTENGRQRPVSFGDFAILMRFLSSHGQTYADVLNRNGVPAYIDKPYSLFGCYEINLIISLLKTIDNPLQDIPVLALLLCPVFGFTADDLTDLRTGYTEKFIFVKLRSCSASAVEGTSLQKKCEYFLKVFDELRKLSVTVPVSRLLDAFFEMTGFLPIINASENGNIRIRNIRKLLNFVRDYEKSSKYGLSGFVRHIEQLEESGTEISAGDTVPADSVRIMSVHHSKGLEFPVCILASLNSKGNSTGDEILCHTDLGLGFKTIDRENMLKFNTLQRNVISLCKRNEEVSEAMRVLYVAMTRAKEQLISVVSYPAGNPDSLENKVKKIGALIKIKDGRISPYSVSAASSLADWIVMCAMVHPSMKALRTFANRDDLGFLPSGGRWEYVLADSPLQEEEGDEEENTEASPDKELLALLKKRFSEEYRHSLRTAIPSKVSASALVHNELLDSYIAASRPSFMQDSNMSGAEKGTAMHRFLQYADFSAVEAEPESELQRLRNGGLLTGEQTSVIDTADIVKFTQSETFSHIKGAERLLREYRFTVNISASDIDPSYPPEEKVILQGAIDCLIFEKDGIILLDYKTDRVRDVSELSQKYKKQLALYKKAAEQLFDLPVRKCCIYSIHKGEETELAV